MTAMTKSPAHWQQPASDKASAAAERRQLKPGKSDLPTPRDSDWHKAAKESGVGFSNNAVQVLVRGDNPAAGEYRKPPEHRYRTQPFGGDSGSQRLAMQNELAAKRRK
jgi:hypothetical protein